MPDLRIAWWKRPETVEIFRPAAMIGSGGAPKRFSMPPRTSFDRDGYSDHFPVIATLQQ